MSASKIKNLLTSNPGLASEWHPGKNGDLTPSDVRAGSNKKVWWQCKKGHEWEAAIHSRSTGNGCPFCSGPRVCADNSLRTSKPDLAKDWHPGKNGILTPDDVTAASNKTVWWQCEKGHEWKVAVALRSRGNGCPYCSGKYASADNNLLVLNPELAKQWHPCKNGALLPSDVTNASGKKVWWQCEKGHEWEAIIGNRSKGVGCPECSKESRTSFPEQAIYFYLKSIFSTTLNRYRYDDKWEIDVYVPELNFGIEYDGYYYHDEKKTSDAEKEKYLVDKGIVFLRVKEMIDMGKECNLRGSTLFLDGKYSQRLLNDVIKLCFSYVSENITHKISDLDVDVDRDRSKIYELYIQNEKDNSLLSKNPELAKQWHKSKNLSITPEMVRPNSNKKVWWICENGHEWEAVVNSRAAGNGCPYCSGRFPSKENNLQVSNPELASQWHPTKNGVLIPSAVTSGTPKKIWWLCNKGHEWKASVSGRTKGSNCPYCAGKRACVDNSLRALKPDLAKDWHPVKNGALTPDDVTGASNKKIWWLCEHDHAWEANISDRVRGNGCPYCSGRLATSESNLLVLNPELAKQWHPTKNGDLTPDGIKVCSGKKVWWHCEKGHEWEAQVNSRSQGVGCPYCSGKKVCSDNSLHVVNPELAAQWHPSKNYALTPSDITTGSSKKVWWQCALGHEWQTAVSGRSGGQGCPYCSGLRAASTNNLQDLNPRLAGQCHPEKNRTLTPRDFTARSNKIVWWQCEEGHEWEASIKNRSKGNGCPYCAGKRASSESNFSLLNPEAATQ